jgi:hypothetical protein
MMPDSDDPGARIKRLAERLGKQAAKEGLTMRAFSYAPNLEGDGPDTVQTIFSLDGELPATDEEQERFNREFDEMMRQQRAADLGEQVNDVRAKLEKRLRDEGGGILDDD